MCSSDLRFPALPIAGVADDTQRTANVSLGRSAKFDAAIFGNSHGQLLDPERLSQATNLSFVQLTIPGAKAPEQIATLQWFIHHHSRIGAIVLAADNRWCEEDPQPWHDFPFWLYGESNLTYLVHLLSTRPLTAAYRRLRFALGLMPPSHPRGYDDYEIGLSKNYTFTLPPVPSLEEYLLASSVPLGDRPFPAIDRLAAELARLPADARIVILLPPRHYSELPVHADAAAVLRECKARLARLVAKSPRRGFLDFLVDSPMTRDPGNFDDTEHYRAHIARQIEAEIARIFNAADGG